MACYKHIERYVYIFFTLGTFSRGGMICNCICLVDPPCVEGNVDDAILVYLHARVGVILGLDLLWSDFNIHVLSQELLIS